METQSEILQLLHLHISKYPAQATDLAGFIAFVQEHAGADLFSRKNCTGHLTASAFIIDNTGSELLLLKHKFLNRWLQPGGHIDATDLSLLQAALREAEEETGIKASELKPVGSEVLDFNSHAIPANERKQESAHSHHDVRFLFVTHKAQITLAVEELSGSKWLPFTSLAEDGEFGEVIQKINFRLEQF